MYYGNSRCLEFVALAAFNNCRNHMFPLVFPSYLIREQVDLIRAEDLNLINAILTK